MSERAQFLEEIKNNPKDHTLRLVYADWLDENGSGDLDVATSEFIRASCSLSKATSIMPRKAYAWIKDNWRRLIPSVMDLHVTVVYATPPDAPASFTIQKCNHIKSFINGRFVQTHIGIINPRYVPNRSSSRPVYFCTFNFDCWKGFVTNVNYWSSYAGQKIKDALCRDQPLVKMTNLSELPIQRPTVQTYPLLGNDSTT